MENKKPRIGEVDFLRGIAIILMVTFHLLYDLNEFYGIEKINYHTGLIYYLGKISALMFITITGISSYFSRHNFKRGLQILFFAMIITIITYIYDPKVYINFGILHFLGTSILLFSLFKKLTTYRLLILSILSIILGKIFSNFTLSHDFLSPFGLTSSTYQSLDYYPLFPYLASFLLGIILKRLLYHQNKSLLKISLEKNIISNLGRHSLFIYLIHQPFLLSLLFLLTKLGVF